MSEYRKLLKRLKEIDSTFLLLSGETPLQLYRGSAELQLNDEQHLRTNNFIRELLLTELALINKYLQNTTSLFARRIT